MRQMLLGLLALTIILFALYMAELINRPCEIIKEKSYSDWVEYCVNK